MRVFSVDLGNFMHFCWSPPQGETSFCILWAKSHRQGLHCWSTIQEWRESLASSTGCDPFCLLEFAPLEWKKSSLTIVAAHDFGERCKRLVFHRCFQDASYDVICQLQVNHSKKFATTVRAELCRRPHTHELLWSCNEPLRRVRVLDKGSKLQVVFLW